ncbi:MAG: hemolysin III family protein [Bacteroidetes bacterium]|nr:hemolysin III family protein [Bacteroidota bacterium]
MGEYQPTPSEEKLNTATHGLGFLIGLVLIPLLIIRAYEFASPAMFWGTVLFGFGWLMMYLASTLYHVVKEGKLKHIFRIWDHVSIFVLTAATYTPLVIKYVETTTAIIFLSIMWFIVLLGGFLKIFYVGRFEIISLILYLSFGWMAVFIIKPIMNNMPLEIFWWVLSGGVVYTAGVAFYAWEKLPYHHGIWHCFVLGGTILHFVAIYKSLLLKIVIY